jgi:hypothetical protein
MIVDIRKFIYDKLYNHEDNRMENTNYKALRGIYDFIGDYKIGINGNLTTITENINFKGQKGGAVFSIKLSDKKTYKYHLDKITSLNKNNTEHELCFLNINEDERCMCFTFHSKETGINILTIHDLLINNNDEYIECEKPQKNIKSGELLVKILIELVKTNEAFSHIKYIELQDNTIKKCYGIGIQLKYLKTITDGIPYYAKFGFKPKKKSNDEIFEFNKNKYIESSKFIKNDKFDNLFTILKKDNEKLYKFYETTYRPYILNNKKIDYILYIRQMIDMEKDNKNSISKKKLTCELVAEIIKQLYILIGYKDYNTDLWVLKIIR